MKKNFLTSIILLAFMLLASCTPPEAPDTKPSVKPGENSDDGYISQVLRIEREYRPDRTLSWQYYVTNGESDWTYHWKIEDKTVNSETAIINMQELEWGKTYTLNVEAHDITGKYVVGRGSTEIKREPCLVIKQNLSNPATGTYELRPILDIGTKVDENQKFDWEIFDNEGIRITPQPKKDDPGVFVVSSKNSPISVICKATVGKEHTLYERHIYLEVQKEGIKSDDTFVSGQAKSALGEFSGPMFEYYNVDWSDEDYSKYRYVWRVGTSEDDLPMVHGFYKKRIPIDVHVKPEDMVGHSADVIVSCTIQPQEGALETEPWTVQKVVTYIEFLDVVKEEIRNEKYDEIWFLIPFMQDGYEYDLVVGSPCKTGDQDVEMHLPGTFGTTAYNMISNIPSQLRNPDYTYFDEYYVRVRGVQKNHSSERIDRTVYSRPYRFKVDNKTKEMTWIN